MSSTAHTQPPVDPIRHVVRSAGRRARLSGMTTGDPMQDLLAALPEALGRRMKFHEPTAAEKSFDEIWLENLLDAVRQNDVARYRFALHSRMSRERASRLHFLICKAAHDAGTGTGRSSAAQQA
ncbi:hypothetical protein [Yoonia vestfoldensis]|uniref:hypothetical protein n=1 Tax=Yoonia vestfoldensis TaxID=245188 RepID=UPI000376DCD3|nr:hypothetical protein [Yoonia vestfoldensis]